SRWHNYHEQWNNDKTKDRCCLIYVKVEVSNRIKSRELRRIYMSSKYDIYAPVVNLLNSQHKTDKEIERIIGVDSRRISDIRKRNNIIRVYPSETPLKFTNLEYQLLIGGLVGDLCIFKDKKSIYHRFSFAHSTKQKSYFLLKYNLLK